MKRILGLLCIAAIIATSMISTSVVSLAETTNGPTVTNIYATGNWIEGETVTAHYNTQDENVKIQWYRTGNLNDNTAIDGGTSVKYTLQRADAYDNFNSVYFTVTDNSGKVFYSPVYAVFRRTEEKSKVQKAHLIVKSGGNYYLPGVSVGIDHNTAFVNEEEGTHTYEWRIKDTANDTDYEIVGSNDTYTVQESDYGKYLEGAITVKTAAGTAIGTYTAIAYVGCKFDFDAATIATSNFYHSFPLSTTLWYHSEDILYTKQNTVASVTIDAKKSVRFDGFKLYVKNVASDLQISCSNDNTNWSDLPLSGTLAGNIKQDYSFGKVYTARYFKVSFKSKESSYGILYEAFPYLSAANKAADDTDITSVGYGAEIDNVNRSITNILYGTPVGKLTESIVTAEKDATITLTDADGVSVDPKDAKITAENVCGYSVKVTYGESSQSYTLAIADALKTIDLSKVVNERYTAESVEKTSDTKESTGYTANIPGAKATYWYSSAKYTNSAKETAELYPYAVREEVDGEDALAVHTNGNPRDTSVVDMWYTATDLDEEGCYSFSFKVKPDSGSHIQVGGRPSNYLTGEYANFDGGFVQLNSYALMAHNGTEMKQKGDFLKEKWYDVEVVVDYKNMKKSVWVNGDFYADGVDLKFSDGSFDKTTLSMYIKILASQSGKNDVNYIKDIKFSRVWDVRSRATANSDSVGMKLYSGDSVVNKLSPGTYSAKSYGDLICDKFYVAVYKVEYSDSSKSVQKACYPVKVYGTSEKVDSVAVINDIVVPEDIYSETSDARIMIFCWNNVADPACDFVQID